jgi:hypothetical protein
MRFSAGRLLSLMLLGVYGSIVLLGHGLHELSAVHHHHHGPALVAAHVGHHHHDHGHPHHHGPYSGHHHHPAPAPTGDSISHTHDCEICEFLAQIRSEMPQLVSADFSTRCVAEAAVAAPRVISQTPLGLHAPRGPPALWS